MEPSQTHPVKSILSLHTSWIAAVFLANAPLCAGIKWDSAQPVLIQAGGHYGRITRIAKDTLIAGFDFKRAIHIRLSHDEGRTWEAPVKVAESAAGILTNTELCALKNGDVLCFFNLRPHHGGKVAYSIGLSRSSDGAKTWSAPATLHSAGLEFGDGCWEPAAIQLPAGEVQVYFANEGPFPRSNEQEISMLRSADNGLTWSPSERITFRKNSRDGMPVPIVATDLDCILLAIEDNGLHGTFKPVIVSTTLERGGWRDGPVGGDSPRRWSALAKPLDRKTYAGAPYLRRFPNGRFVLSYQLAESGNMRESRMAVSLGSNRARDFGEPSFPFPDGAGGAQLWNALFIKNDRTITAITETTRNGVHGIWAVDGTLEP
jgi:hypothetical protein